MKNSLSIIILLIALFCINFKVHCSEKDSTNVLIFPDTVNCKHGEVKTYDPEEVKQVIYAEANLFLQYNLEKMKTTEYSCNNSWVAVQVFKFKTTIDAFGAYSQERPESNVYFNIGVQGYKENESLNFLTGKYYIKMRVENPAEKNLATMNSIASKMAQNLNGNTTFPLIFNTCPTEGRIPFSERYISHNVLGYNFLHSAYQVDYKIHGSKCTISILNGVDEADAITMLKNYFSYHKQPIEDTSDGLYQILDNRLGTITILKEGKYLICMRGSLVMEETVKMLNELKTKLSILEE